MTIVAKDNFLAEKLLLRNDDNSLRTLPHFEGLIDFCSNDYLGFSKSMALFHDEHHADAAGSTGSRLISGNSFLAEETEKQIASFHGSEAALIYNCGYMANVGLFSSILQKNDTVICDELIHASVIDGTRLSPGNRYKFRHNDVGDLERVLENTTGRKYVAVEAIYSMDGDEAPLKEIVHVCKKYDALLIVDEAHSNGIIGKKGEGLVSSLGLQSEVFARVVTFGKAIGLHGAAILGSKVLIDYLINFSRAFIYTTALPPLSYRMISQAYLSLPEADREKLFDLIDYFKSTTSRMNSDNWQLSNSPIKVFRCKGNDHAKQLASKIIENGFAVKAILHPTVPKGKERLRICLHSFNSKEEIDRLLGCMNDSIV